MLSEEIKQAPICQAMPKCSPVNICLLALVLLLVPMAQAGADHSVSIQLPSFSLYRYYPVDEDVIRGRTTYDVLYSGHIVRLADGRMFRFADGKGPADGFYDSYLINESRDGSYRLLGFGTRDPERVKSMTADIHWPLIPKAVNVNYEWLVQSHGELLVDDWRATARDLVAELYTYGCQHPEFISELIRRGADTTLTKQLIKLLTEPTCMSVVDEHFGGSAYLLAKALHVAISGVVSGTRYLVELVERGADTTLPLVETFPREDEWPLLTYAIVKDHHQGRIKIYSNLCCHDFIDYLLEQGAEPDVTGTHGATALHWAVVKTHTWAVKSLLRHGARTDIEDDFNQTALDIAKAMLASNWREYKPPSGAYYSVARAREIAETMPKIIQLLEQHE